ASSPSDLSGSDPKDSPLDESGMGGVVPRAALSRTHLRRFQVIGVSARVLELQFRYSLTNTDRAKYHCRRRAHGVLPASPPQSERIPACQDDSRILDFVK